MSKSSERYPTPYGRFAENFDCCNTSDPDDQTGQDDCLDHWKEELKEATKKFELANARATKFSEIHNNAVIWENKLETWCDNVVDTSKKSVEICNLLESFMAKIAENYGNASQTKEAIQAVLCLEKKIFECLVDLLKIPPEEESGYLQNLKTAVECDKYLDEKQKHEILTCIQVFEDKIKVVYDMQDAVIKELLEMLNCASLVMEYLGERKGLQWQLGDLKKRLQGEEKRSENVRHACGHMPEDPDEPCGIKTPPCGDEVFDPGKILFPVAESEYCIKVKELYGQAQDDSECLECEVIDANSVKDKASVRKNQFDQAVKAAETAEAAA